jgi:hydrogenase-4 membrane subunit HyfE
VSPGLALALIASGVLLVVVRRRSAAIAVVAAQALLLGAAAMASGIGHSTAMATGGAALIAKGVVLPVVLLWVVRRTREPRLIVEERHAGTRAAVSVALALGLVLILGGTRPGFGAGWRSCLPATYHRQVITP